MEGKLNEWNRGNGMQYTLRDWAWYKGDKNTNTLISGMYDKEIPFSIPTINIEEIDLGYSRYIGEKVYKTMREAYEGKILLGPRGDMGDKGDQKIGFKY